MLGEPKDNEYQRITLDLTIVDYQRLKIACAKERCTMKDVFIYVLRKWLAKIEEKR